MRYQIWYQEGDGNGCRSADACITVHQNFVIIITCQSIFNPVSSLCECGAIIDDFIWISTMKMVTWYPGQHHQRAADQDTWCQHHSVDLHQHQPSSGVAPHHQGERSWWGEWCQDSSDTQHSWRTIHCQHTVYHTPEREVVMDYNGSLQASDTVCCACQQRSKVKHVLWYLISTWIGPVKLLSTLHISQSLHNLWVQLRLIHGSSVVCY